MSKTNIKEYRDSFSYEKFNFRSNPNITFYVYVSNFSWPIKIQVSMQAFISNDVESFHGETVLICLEMARAHSSTPLHKAPPVMMGEDERPHKDTVGPTRGC